MKLYIKKFLWLLLIMNSAVWLLYIYTGILGNLIGVIFNHYYLRQSVGFLATMGTIIPVIITTKIKNKSKRQEYFYNKNNTKARWRCVLKSKDLYSEILVFLLLIFPVIINVVTKDTESIIETVFVVIFTCITTGICYGFLSFFILLLVYHTWERANPSQ